MRPRPFEEPRLAVARAGDLPLSGKALLALMQAVLARGVPFRFRARGWSMAPFIRDGDVITVSPLRGAFPRIGQVVAFVRPGTEDLVVHRVVARKGTASVIRGDGVPDCTDGRVRPENLVGWVTRVQRNGHDVRLGLGPERSAIAWLSRTSRLIPLRTRLPSWLRRLLRR